MMYSTILSQLLVTAGCLLVLVDCQKEARGKDRGDEPEVCPDVCEPEKCPNVGPIGLSQCPLPYIVTYRCGCCKRCDIAPVTTTMSPSKRDEVCQQITCPKKKVCVLNIQGIPQCKCPTEELCRKFVNKGVGKKMKVCGSDGVTYPSRCHLKVSSCSAEQRKIRVLHKGDCQTPDVAEDTMSESITHFPNSTTTVVSARRHHPKNKNKGRLQGSDNEAALPLSQHTGGGRRRKGERKGKKRAEKKREKTYQRALRASRKMKM